MVAFKTIVILDLETTGLPHMEHGRTRITEMSLVACLISHCQGGEILPRVINKLILVLNPMKMILPETSKITGLVNELLEEFKSFDDNVVSMLNGFLERLPQPVCLVAHNGLRFDFPILMRQLLKCETKFIDNIYCADSLLAFREILQNSKNSPNTKIHKPLNKSTIQPDDAENQRMSTETTPEKRTVQYNAQPHKPSVHFVTSEYSNVSRKLNFDNDIHSSNSNNYNNHLVKSEINQTENHDSLTVSEPPKDQKSLKSHKLIDIYIFLHNGKVPTFHRAEDDCMALLSCINKCKNAFISWLYDNAMPLTDVKPLF